ncbi:helix-turn-helix transcriptional regulator [Pelagibius sp.]|uniref:ArsR/SmtB family transcription factor n=1 Tax=Pelagibius sp. TaxID=1931238 RepID=UPI0026196652|nr:helix-turn-helix transcriptional regulator [Pelagibius sp.]
MENAAAIKSLAALAQATRLDAFRILVREGPEGLAAGVLAARLGVQPATLSFHLAQLERAGLLVSQRRSRQILYAADFGAMRALLGFLLEDCCHGRPEVCGDLLPGTTGEVPEAERTPAPDPASGG